MTTKEPSKTGPKARKSRNNVSEETQKVSGNTGLDSDIVKSDDSVKETGVKRKHLFSGEPGPGRPKGIPNKNTTALKDMIMAALSGAGGVQYLTEQAKENPKAFLSLVGRVLPLQVTGENGGAMTVIVRDYTGRKPNGTD